MSGSCCGSSKSEAAKVAMTVAPPQAAEAVAEQPAEQSRKSECCNDKSAKGKERGCGC